MFEVTEYAALTIGHSNFKLHRCIGHIIKKELSYILCDPDPNVKVIGIRVGICDGVPWTAALVKNYFLNAQSKLCNTKKLSQ